MKRVIFMSKFRFFAITGILSAAVVLGGCGTRPTSNPASTSESAASVQPEEEKREIEYINIDFENQLGFDIWELTFYPSGQASSKEFLGAEVFEKGGSMALEVPAVEGDLYDIAITDEKGSTYNYNSVSILDGNKAVVHFSPEKEMGTIRVYDGESEVFGGKCTFKPGKNYTPMDVTFDIVNNSGKEIYSIFFGTSGGTVESDEDILPYILKDGETFTFEYDIPDQKEGETDWTLVVADKDGNISLDYTHVNPYETSKVIIMFNEDPAGFVCRTE